MKIRFKKYPQATHSTSVSLLYNKALRLYIFVYMLDIACQTARPNVLISYRKPMGAPRVK